MTTRQATTSVDVCILGGGPQGLAASAHLRQAMPDCRIAAVDPAGAWLHHWHDQFARADIPVLRSPGVHHPSPDATALRRHMAASGLPGSGLPYGVPTTESFGRFCDALVQQAELDEPIAGRADHVRRHGEGVQIDVGTVTIDADHLIVATNPHTKVIPDWAQTLMGAEPAVLVHGADVDLRAAELSGRRIAVVGGGLSAAHLACGAASRGADLHLVARRPIRCKNFDADPGWLGPKYLAQFSVEADPAIRLQQALQARDGGTIPEWMKRNLDGHVRDGRLTMHEGTAVTAAGIDREDRCQLTLDDRSTFHADQVWLATGTKPSIHELDYLSDLVADRPTVDGYPVTGPDLRLDPHPVYVMGRLATVTLGPAAGNLWGAQRAAERITRSIAIAGASLGPAARPAPIATPTRPDRPECLRVAVPPPRLDRHRRQRGTTNTSPPPRSRPVCTNRVSERANARSSWHGSSAIGGSVGW